jgi:hypothetical protein
MNIDKRKYNRFLAQKDAFAAFGFSTVGKVKDISMGGLAFQKQFPSAQCAMQDNI